eukprot:763359-Hanusia_phi.AAC.2
MNVQFRTSDSYGKHELKRMKEFTNTEKERNETGEERGRRLQKRKDVVGSMRTAIGLNLLRSGLAADIVHQSGSIPERHMCDDARD